MNIFHHWGLALIAAVGLGAYLATALLGALGTRHGWTAPPRPDRWHSRPIALHGGLGFMLPFTAGAFALLSADPTTVWIADSSWAPHLTPALAVVIGAAFMFICGLWDDLSPLRPGTKLIWQFAAAGLFIHAGGVFSVWSSPLANVLLTYLWIVGLTNAVNMVDNMDGLAAGAAFISLAALGLLTAWGGGPGLPAAGLSMLLAAALAGFWLHNRPPARIFMGDAGSLVLGYTLAVLAVPGALNGYFGLGHGNGSALESLLPVMVPAALTSVFIFDAGFVTITRFFRAAKFYVGGRDHSSHRLVELGLSEKKTLAVLCGLQAAGGLAAAAALAAPPAALPLLGLFFLGLALFGGYLSLVSGPGPAPANQPHWPSAAAQYLLVRRRLAAVMVDALLVIICFQAAYLLRFEFNPAPFLQAAMLQALPLVLVCCLAAMALTGGYGEDWRLISVSDLPRYGLGAGLGTVLSLAAVTIFSRFGQGHSRAAYIIFGCLFFLAMALSRFSFQILNRMVAKTAGRRQDRQPPILIYGVNHTARFLVEELVQACNLEKRTMLGFIAVDGPGVERKIAGLPARGREYWRRALTSPPEIWVATPDVSDFEALDLANSWQPRAVVRRYEFTLKPVSPPGQTT
jgi:UDP-GlcNAc:undecaprenyl-phosphate GlcNAc-1-phosphate transferase